MTDSVESIHLLVLVHGMWGHPGHLAEMARIIVETKAADDGPRKLHVLLAETNREDGTYDGIDWGAERVAQEVTEEVEKLAAEGKKVTHFSVTGYSLGGLVSRYLVGILHQRNFFDDVQPMNFNTVATPHIGLLRYPSTFSAVINALGPRLLSRTGEQFYCVDTWSNTNRPLLEVMADPAMVFYEALSRFKHLRIYANAINDMTVPYPTAAIESSDPFADISLNGLEIDLHEKYRPIIQSLTYPPSPPPPAPSPALFSRAWFRRLKPSRPLLPPFLQFRFPLNLVLYCALPLLIPLFITMVFVRFTLASRSSRQRIKLMEKDSPADTRLIHIIASIEKKVEDAVADFIDQSNPQETGTEPQSSTSLHVKAGSGSVSSAQPILSPVQKKIVVSLNKLPIKKELAFIENVRNSHATIAFSAYAPQLGDRLRLSHTQLNVIGIAGNIGVFSSAPFWGRTVDSHGPKPLFAAAFFLLLGGYSGIRFFYDTGEALSRSTMPAMSYFLLAFCNFMTGVAGTAGIMGSVNTIAKTFPDEARASTTGLVLSGFGLSAFLFSAIASLAFPGDTSALLLFLAIGTATPLIMGYFFIRPIPFSDPAADNHPRGQSDPESSVPNIIYHRCSEDGTRTPLLSASGCNCYHTAGASASHQSLDYPTPTPDTLMTPDTLRTEDPFSDSSMDVRRIVLERRRTSTEFQAPTPSPALYREEPNIYGWELWKTTEFLLMFAIFGLLTGTGLMYINNVGAISQALIAQNDPDYDITLAARIQAKQVTIISSMNCAGRVIFGFVSDFTKARLEKPRSYCFMLTSGLFLVVQVVLKMFITNVHTLSLGSAMLGFVYGGSFSFLPALAIHYFGFAHFSENFGFITLSPIISGYLFSQIFGRTLDAHEAPPTSDGNIAGPQLSLPPQIHQCLEGSACYTDAFNATILACIVALSLSLWLSWKDTAKAKDEGGSGYAIKTGSLLQRTVESG
ncbi:hypothetical protein ONZ45_g13353 [Pleurotus djamor]|nr:hypothetical protein ONZ45_g13353 [Pleurotus djamor]